MDGGVSTSDEKCKRVGNGRMFDRVWDGVTDALVKEIIYCFADISNVRWILATMR